MRSPILASRSYPHRASNRDIELFVRGIHGHEEDFVDGDLCGRLLKFSTYVLRDWPVDEIDHTEFDVHLPTAKIYARRLKRGERAPPIVYDAEDRSIIDGLHRVNGAVQAGVRSILTYAGLRENRNPAWHPD